MLLSIVFYITVYLMTRFTVLHYTQCCVGLYIIMLRMTRNDVLIMCGVSSCHTLSSPAHYYVFWHAIIAMVESVPRNMNITTTTAPSKRHWTIIRWSHHSLLISSHLIWLFCILCFYSLSHFHFLSPHYVIFFHPQSSSQTGMASCRFGRNVSQIR